MVSATILRTILSFAFCKTIRLLRFCIVCLALTVIDRYMWRVEDVDVNAIQDNS